MLKYVDTKIVFQEIPDEITLAINISNCPCQCKGCHSSYLAEDIGYELTTEVLDNFIRSNKGITCIAFMGGDIDVKEINILALIVKVLTDDTLKVAWYSGRQELCPEIDLCNFDYIKLGPYVEELGPLNSKTTNQKLYKIVNNELINITERFWK